jgi:hypothetical protein
MFILTIAPKRHLEFTKLAKIIETKGNKITKHQNPVDIHE